VERQKFQKELGEISWVLKRDFGKIEAWGSSRKREAKKGHLGSKRQTKTGVIGWWFWGLEDQCFVG